MTLRITRRTNRRTLRRLTRHPSMPPKPTVADGAATATGAVAAAAFIWHRRRGHPEH